MEPTDQRRYQVQEVLGRGGFGTVYRAQLLGSGGFRKEVALKVLNPDMAANADVVRRLRDEARMLGLLRHRSIVNVDALSLLEGRWTIVMEYVDGASLRDLLGLGPVPVSAALEIVEEVATALDVAWSTPGEGGRALGLLHRDIKPGNVQITARGEVKLLDFGVAKADFGDREAHTRSLIFGSIHYLAPERLDFEDTHKGDVYALGCTLYEMLVGEQLDKASINPRKHAAKVVEARARVLATHRDLELADLIAATLAYEPEDRPDARDLERTARALRRVHAEPWLRDWAETTVPRAQARRSHQDDDWSGATLNESGGRDSDTMALPQEVASAEDLEVSPVGAPPEDPPALPVSPPRPPEPPPRRRRTVRPRPRKPRVGRWLVGIALTLLLLLVVTPVVLVVATGGGLYALVVGTGAWNDSIIDDLVELEGMVQGCAASPERDELVRFLQQHQHPSSGDTIGLMEIVNFRTLVENRVMDGVIDARDVRAIKQQWTEITAS